MPILLGNVMLRKVMHVDAVQNDRYSMQVDQNPLRESTDITSGANVGLAAVILAMVSVLFIIFGIAFVYRFRNKYHQDDDSEEQQQKKKDPIEVWLNTVEPSFPPCPPLKKKVRNVVCSVHRKISGKPDPDKFIPGCPPHLRYQLKTLVVY